MFPWWQQAPHPQPPSLGRCRPSRNGNRQPRPLEVEETRPPPRVDQAHTVPGSYHGARGSQPNVADVFTVSCWVKIYGTLNNGYDIVLFLMFPANTVYQAREQGPGAPSPATLSRPMPAKSQRKSAAPTPRNRGDPAPVARSPGAHGSTQLSRCPR